MKKKLLICFIAAISAANYAHGQVISTIAGIGTAGYSGDGGAATMAELNIPMGVAVDADGNVYITDYGNSRIRKVNTSGIISTFAGIGAAGYSGNGGPATAAELNDIEGIAVDAGGNVYIADYGNSRVRKVNTSGIISTVAGNGSTYSGDGGPATDAGLGYVYDVAVDGNGNIYIAGYNNRIRKVNAAGIISTFAGNGTAGNSGDGGPAIDAELYLPAGVAVDESGNVYIADGYNDRIRKVNTSGIISTIAGISGGGYNGDGGAATAATLYEPSGVAVDAGGNVYIADNANQRIRKVNTSGIISTIAGNGTGGYSGDGGAATAAELGSPNHIAVDGNGNLYIADEGNNRVRKVSANGSGVAEANTGMQTVKIYPNPTSGVFTIEAPANATIIVCDIYGKMMTEKAITDNTGKASFDLSDLARGMYLVKVTSEGQTWTEKLILY